MIQAKSFDQTLHVGDAVQLRGIKDFNDWTISEIYREETSGSAKCIIYNRAEIKRDVDPMDLKRA